MAKIFQTVVKRTTVIIPPSGDTVVNERVTYDRPEVVPNQTARDAIRPVVSEAVPPQQEAVVAALLARAEETSPTPEETIRTTVASTERETVPGQTEAQAVITRTSETVQTISDAIRLMMTTGEAVPEQTETVRITPIVMAFEAVPLLTENVTAAIIEQDNAVPPPVVTEPINASLTGYANAVVSNATWVNPNNGLGNTTGTAATLTATASGVAGTTNNTATGTVVYGFQDVNLGDLTITNVTVNVENQGATAGVAIAQPTSNVQFQYSLNNGSTWTNIFVLNTPATAKGIRTLNITGVVGQDQTLLSALQIRATGSITSGTGLGVSNTVSFFRSWMTVTANKTYT